MASFHDSLSDATAKRIVLELAAIQINRGTPSFDLTPELDQALQQTFHVAPSFPVTEGALARDVLTLASDDELMAGYVEKSARTEPAVSKYDVSASSAMALTTAVLVVLQTHVRFERDKQGRWSVTVEKKPANNSLLLSVVSALLSFRSRAQSG